MNIHLPALCSVHAILPLIASQTRAALAVGENRSDLAPLFKRN